MRNPKLGAGSPKEMAAHEMQVRVGEGEHDMP